MRRAVLAVLVVALATAGPAAAVRLKARATFAPPVQLFGNTVTARVSVVTDTTRVDPAGLHVITKFSPWRPVGPPRLGGILTAVSLLPVLAIRHDLVLSRPTLADAGGNANRHGDGRFGAAQVLSISPGGS
jgi:hypothetical protein